MKKTLAGIMAAVVVLAVVQPIAQAHERVHHKAAHKSIHYPLSDRAALDYVKKEYAAQLKRDHQLKIVLDHTNHDQFGRADYLVHVFDWNGMNTATIAWLDIGDNGVIINYITGARVGRVR